MKKISLLFALLIYGIGGHAQAFWEDESEENFEVVSVRTIVPDRYRTLSLDTAALKAFLDGVPREMDQRPSESASILEVPTPNGTSELFRIVEYAMMEPGLAGRYPDIRTYRGVSISDPRRRIRADWTSRGFRAMVSTLGGSYFIDPFYPGNMEACQVYFKHDFPIPDEPFSCGWEPGDIKPDPGQSAQRTAGDCVFRSYRLVVATTGEYSNYHGADDPSESDLVLSEVVTAVNRVNEVYEADVTLRMVLIDNTDDVFYYDPNTDPYNNGNGGQMLGQNQTTCDNVIGDDNYDIGHVFSTGGGGVANLAVPCRTGWKARGVTGLSNPTGDPFYIDYVAHEMGHQYGANHTQYNPCNRVNATAMEPGSASTIMGYAGICPPNVQSNSDAYFHAISIAEISNYITNGSGNDCDVPLGFTNTAPDLAPVMDYTIPVSTPFKLTAVASDMEEDSLSFCWEEWDNDGSAPQPPESTNTEGPMFRTLFATESPTRYFPNLADLANNIDPEWEELPSVSRDMEFRITVRDYHDEAGCTDEDNLFVTTTDQAGPFVVLVPNTPVTWTEGVLETVDWDVASTDVAPVSCSQVDILLSCDGGMTYPAILASGVANDGSHEVFVPAGTGTMCRVMVICHDNIFFDISDEDFEIVAGAPGFYLASDTPAVSVCPEDDAVFPIDIVSIGGFVGPVSFSLSGFPAGSVPVFDPNPALAGNNTELTISNLMSASPGTYQMTATGVGSTGSRQIDLELTILDDPMTIALDMPADGEINVELQPEFTWLPDANAASYELEVATDDSFAFPVISVTVTSANHIPATALMSDTEYFWRARGLNMCTEGEWSETRSFTTRSCATFMSTDVPVTIPSNQPATVTSDLVVDQTGAVNDLNVVNLTGNHSWVGDLTITIISPNGTEVILFEEICGSNNDFNLNFDDDSNTSPPCPPTDGGTHEPQEPLSAFNGEDLDGTWTLEVHDSFNQDGGSLESWGVEVCWDFVPCDPLVTSLASQGPGSLREIIDCAEPGDTITFDPTLYGDTIVLKLEPIILDKDITIFNLAANAVVLNGNLLGHVFEITSGSTVHMEGLDLLVGSEMDGPGIRNSGNLVLKDFNVYENGTVPGASGLIKNFGTLGIEGNCNILLND